MQSVPVPAAVVLGRAAPHRSANAVPDGIQIIDGRELSRWAVGVSGHEILRDAGKAALARLREYRTAVTRTA